MGIHSAATTRRATSSSQGHVRNASLRKLDAMMAAEHTNAHMRMLYGKVRLKNVPLPFRSHKNAPPPAQKTQSVETEMDALFAVGAVADMEDEAVPDSAVLLNIASDAFASGVFAPDLEEEEEVCITLGSWTADEDELLNQAMIDIKYTTKSARALSGVADGLSRLINPMSKSARRTDRATGE